MSEEWYHAPAAAYDALEAGENEADLAERLGYNDYRIMLGSAARYAEREGLPFPPKGLVKLRRQREAEREKASRDAGRACYRAREVGGLSWGEIGKTVGLTPSGACRRAERYAKKYGLEWPIEEPA